MSYSEVQTIGDLGNLFISARNLLIVAAAILCLFMVFAYMHRKQKDTKSSTPAIAATAFTSRCFGVLNVDKDETGKNYGVRRAVIYDGKGNELCAYEEADGQTIKGFTSENGVLYMHTTETYEDGTVGNIKWVFALETNEFIEC